MGVGGTAVGASPMQVSMRIVLMVVVVSSLVSGLVGGLVVAVLDDDRASGQTRAALDANRNYPWSNN